MRQSLLVLLIASSCGGGSSPSGDYADAFVGLWTGTVTIRTTTQSASMPISRTGTNTILLENLCADGTGPTARATGPTTFSVGSLRCAPASVTGCDAVTLAINGGSGTLANSTLSVSFDTTVSGCSQSSSVSFSFSGTRGAAAPTQPAARIAVQPTGAVPVRSMVTLDGSGSTDPQGRSLQYTWRLQTPPASTAALSNPNGAQTSLLPDVAGPYVVTLTVSNGTQTSVPATLTIVAGSSMVAVVLAPTLQANRGESIALDASGSADAQGRTLHFAWTLQSAPAGSNATLSDASAPIAHLTPDLNGSYVVEVLVTAGDSSAKASTTVQAGPPLPTIAFRPIDAKYSRALDRIVAIATGPDKLHLLGPVSQEDVAVTLPLPPRCVSISGDGLYAAVGYDAWVSYVDLTNAQIIKTWPLAASAGDIVLGDAIAPSGTRIAYVFPSRDQWVTIHAVDLGSGGETTFATIYAGMHAALQPHSSHLFGVTSGLSPAQLYRFDFDSSGILNGGGQSPYWGDYSMGPRIWVSGDGQQILTSAGTRFRASDMTYAGTVSLGDPNPVGIASADWSAAAGRWALQPAAGYGPSTSPMDTSFWTVDTQYLASPSQVPYPQFVHAGHGYAVHGRFLFFDSSGTKRVALAEVDESANLLDNYVVLVL